MIVFLNQSLRRNTRRIPRNNYKWTSLRREIITTTGGQEGVSGGGLGLFRNVDYSEELELFREGWGGIISTN